MNDDAELRKSDGMGPSGTQEIPYTVARWVVVVLQSSGEKEVPEH